jgi:hypothetical protein
MSETARLNTLERWLLWLVANALLTAAVAWIAFQMQQEDFAPAVLFPLLVGTALGAAGVGVLRLTGLPSVRGALVGAAVWGLLAVFAQDYIGHRYRLRLYDEELGRQNPLVAVVAAERPEIRPHFGEFLLGVVRGQPVWWSLDLLLTSGASVAVTAMGLARKRITTSNAV